MHTVLFFASNNQKSDFIFRRSFVFLRSQTTIRHGVVPLAGNEYFLQNQ